jgi:iron(III) transport system permease protein
MQMSPAVSFTVLVAALTAKFYAVASKNARSVLSCEKKCVFESAQLLSPNLWQSFHQVFWKGSRPAWFAGALLVILEVMKEVPITLVLRPFGFHSLSTLVFELSTEGLYEQASLPALFLVCLGMLFLYLLDPERRDLQYEH